MQKTGYRAKDFIQKGEKWQEWECGICFELSTELVRCQGPCQKVFCMECVSQTKNVSDRCPNRCSRPFFATKLTPPPFTFNCPFSSLCKHSIGSASQFANHHQLCLYTPATQRDRVRLRSQYKCQKQHLLQFFIGKYSQMISSECKGCGQTRLCRSICRKCDQKYCVGCRMPPCSRKSCPLGHAFTLFKDRNLSYICDVCGLNASIFSTGIYDDKACNFGICQNCIGHLPEQAHHKVHIISNQEQCHCGSSLKYFGGLPARTCGSCERLKQCPKQCSDCGLTFCLKCKGMAIYGDICQFHHTLKGIGAEQHEGGCMRCQKLSSSYLHDSECGVTICNQCWHYLHAVASDKKRLRAVQCQAGHKLSFTYQAQRMCRKCQQMRDTQLLCVLCQGKDVNYCFQCRPISLHACYFDHPLLPLLPNSLAVACSLCRSQSSSQACLKCKFYVCSGCKLTTQMLALAIQ